MDTSKYGFEKVFQNTGDAFSGLRDAQNWLKEKGFSYGPLCFTEPVGIIKGERRIEKWKNLPSQDRAILDGVLISGDFRSSYVTVFLIEEPG